MNWLIFGGIVILALLPFTFRGLVGRRGRTARVSYRKRDFLFSPEQRFFFSALKEALADSYEIFGKLPVADLVEPRAAGNPKKNAQELDIPDLIVDFVVCDKNDLSVVCAVELLDHSGSGRRSAAADPMRSICSAAGLPLVRFEAGPLYDPVEIRTTVAAAVRREPLTLTDSSDRRREPRISSLEDLEI